MKKIMNGKALQFSGMAEVVAIVLMVSAFIAGTYVEQALCGLPDRVNFKQCLPWLVVFTAGTMYFNSAFDLSRRLHYLVFAIFASILMINVLMMALPFFEVLYYVQITTLLITFVLECLCMGIWLFAFRKLWLYRNSPLNTLVICDDMPRGKEIARKINEYSQTHRVKKIVLFGENQFESALKHYDAVLLVKPSLDIKNEIALQCWNADKELIIVPEVYELIINNASFVQFDDLMAYRIKSLGLTQNQRFFKRLADIVLSVLALTLLSPLMLITILVIRRDGGPAFFTQNRVTRDGRVFRLYKFRTMIPDAEKYTGPTLALKDDPRITKAGKWFRQSRLDEIPQFWNVLIGDMSIVGPRPEREHFINLYMQTLPEYQFREKVRAGITGLAHVLGKYSTTPEERIKLDLTYIQNYSLFLDLKILIETIRIVFSKEFAEGVKEKTPSAVEPRKEKV